MIGFWSIPAKPHGERSGDSSVWKRLNDVCMTFTNDFLKTSGFPTFLSTSIYLFWFRCNRACQSIKGWSRLDLIFAGNIGTSMGATFHCHVWWNQRLSFFLQPSFSGWKRILMQVWADQVSSKTSWLFGRHNVVYSSDLQSMYVQFTSYCKLEYCMYIMHIKFPNYPRYFIPT